MTWFVQIRQPNDVMDGLVVLGDTLPSLEEFIKLIVKQKVELPSDFEVNYYKPAINSLLAMGSRKSGWHYWPHVSFQILPNNIWMSIQGFGDRILECKGE